MRAPLRVTFVMEAADMSGGVRVVSEYAKRLRRRGHAVTVVSTPWVDLPFRLKLSHLWRKGEWFRAPALGPSHLEEAEREGVKRVVLKRYRAVQAGDVPDGDVVVATTWRTGHWVQALPASKGAKFHFMQHYEDWAGADAKEGCPAAWALPSRKIVISRWLERIAREEFGQAAAFVPNAVDLERFFAPERGKQQWPTVGLMYQPGSSFKGMDVACQALRLVKNRVPELKVVAFGREEPVAGFALPEPFEFTKSPAQDRIRDIYAKADVWMCSSKSEGFYLPMLEAMACRCPVVSTKVGGPIDVIREGENGFLAEVGDAQGLAEGIERVLKMDAGAWRAMSDAAWRTARAYTWDDATDLFEAALTGPVGENLPTESTRYEKVGAA